MNENTNRTAPKTFDIIDGNTLMAQEYEPLQPAVEKMLPHGLLIPRGAAKSESRGCPSTSASTWRRAGSCGWEFSSGRGGVLCLALEDNHPRLQDRLNKIKAASVDISRLKLSTAAFGISSGLLEQTRSHLAECPDTKLIVIDTLERIRDTEFDKSIYACGCRGMAALRGITDRRRLPSPLIRHTRKLSDPGPLNTLTGSGSARALRCRTQNELKAMREIIRKDLKAQEQKTRYVKSFIAVTKKRADLQALDATVLREFIERIEIFEIDGQSRARRVHIVYNFIGAFDFGKANQEEQPMPTAAHVA